MKSKIFLVSLIFSLMSVVSSLQGMIPVSKRTERAKPVSKRIERANFAETNRKNMLKAFDEGKMSDVFDCISNGASVDLLILHAFTNDHDLNKADKHGRTLLHYAVIFGKEEDVGKLISNGANPFLADISGQTPYGILHSKLEKATEKLNVISEQEKICVSKHTDFCSKFIQKMKNDKAKYLEDNGQAQVKSAAKLQRLQILEKQVARVRELEQDLSACSITQEDFDKSRAAFPQDLDQKRKNIEDDFDGIFEKELSDYTKKRDDVRDNLLQDKNVAHAKELAKLNADKTRFEKKVFESKEILNVVEADLEKRPERKKEILEQYLNGNLYDLQPLFRSMFDHAELIKKMKKACSIIIGVSISVLLRYFYVSSASASQVSSLKKHLLKVKTKLFYIDFDIHNDESVFKPVEEVCNIDLCKDADKQEKLDTALGRFDELAMALYERIKEKYLYHPASYFIEQERLLLDELEFAYANIIMLLDESQQSQKSMLTLFGSAFVGAGAWWYYTYANPFKRWGLF